MTTSTRTKANNFKRITGFDGSMKYQFAVGTASGIVAAVTLVSLMASKSSKTKQVISTTIAATATAIVADKATKRYYTNAEYVCMFTTSLIGFTIVANAGEIF